MRKQMKEITLLVILPLILTSMSLAIVGSSHTIKTVNVNRFVKSRQDPINISIPCTNNLCRNIDNLETIFFEFTSNSLQNKTHV